MNQIELIQVHACPSCAATERTFMYAGCEHEYDNTTNQEVAFHRCNQCALVYLDPRPGLSALPVIYPHNYYSQVSENASPDALNLSSWTGRLVKSRVLSRVYGNLKPHIQLTDEHHFLDIGCGGGRLLKCVQVDTGCKTYGIDFDVSQEVAAQFSESPLVMYRGDFLEHDFGNLRFDVIYAAHLIEHLTNPLDFLRKCSALLTKGGVLVIETPNEDCLPRKIFKTHWGGNHFPRHWFLLNPETVGSAARHAVGDDLELLDVKYGFTSFIWIWTGHSLLLKLGMKTLADFLFPSDHRIGTFTPLSILRHGFFTAFDIGTKWLTGRSSVMAAIYRKASD